MEFRKYVGMHAGYLPGYPASHGCVRMPRDLAADFYARVQVGTPVTVIGSARNVTRVRRAIPIVQPGNSRYATDFLIQGRFLEVADIQRELGERFWSLSLAVPVMPESFYLFPGRE
jgi:hypothetical protein